MKRETKIIDAKDKTLGRLASQIAVILRGKHKPDFLPYKDTGDVVVVKNVRDLVITGRKVQQKKYYHHTGFPGGIKEVPLKRLFKENPAEVLKKAVYGMLPKNKLREDQIKRLKFQNQR
jgi:large subunit ribosomal protein L13